MDNNLVNSRESSYDNVSLAEKRRRFISAVTAYGSSVAINKTKPRPASAKIASSQGNYDK